MKKGIELCFKILGDELAITEKTLKDARFWEKYYKEKHEESQAEIQRLEKTVGEYQKENDQLRVRLAEAVGSDE